METNNQSPRKVIHVSKKKFWIGLVIIIIIGLVVFLRNNHRYYPMPMMNALGISDSSGSIESADIPSINFGGQNSMMPYYPDYNNQQSVKDTREFLKVNYSSQIQTRNVPDTVRNVENTIHSVDGRIDSSNHSEKSGFISFVIPKSRFYEFKDTIEGLTHQKLYTENISSSNLLGEKQSIEQQGSNITLSLSSLMASQKTLTTSHNAQLASLQQTLATASNDVKPVIQKAIDDENQAYTVSNSRLQAQIDVQKRIFQIM
jgi:hypothetical protein